MMNIAKNLVVCSTIFLLACAPTRQPDNSIPSLDYARRVRISQPANNNLANNQSEVAPEVRFVADVSTQEERAALDPMKYAPYQATSSYKRPLGLGNPGIDASLWRDDAGSDFYRDYRAWKPMDLITILVTESSEGKNEANTETKSKSTLTAAISNLLGLENTSLFKAPGPQFDPGVKADSQNDYKGQGKTDRKDTLKGTISAMVEEVLPSGILRVEGKKIITVNSEEHTMVISGLVRPRDINSENQVDSSKIADLRVDYFGAGTVSEKQNGGWLGRIVSKVWPF